MSASDAAHGDELPLTEQPNPATPGLDLLGTRELLALINEEDRRVAVAVGDQLDAMAAAVDATAERLAQGGRLHYFGAGTSGRIAALDAAEIPSTFSFPPDRVVAHIAGGSKALTAAIEAAEDDEESGSRDARSAAIGARDAVVGISASGGARYVIGALRAAQELGTLTVAITNTPNAKIAQHAGICIVLLTGPEVITGSTRMKAGSAQKMALSAMSTAVMVKLGKVYGNLMVDVRATNRKLRARAERAVAALTGATDERVRQSLAACGYNVKVATIMILKRCDAGAGRERLEAVAGNLRQAINAP